MVLDSEDDRKILLNIIAASSIQGTIVMSVATLVKKIIEAEIAETKVTSGVF